MSRIAHRVDRVRQATLNLLIAGTALGLSLLVAELMIRVAFRNVDSAADNTSYFAQQGFRRHPPKLNSLGFREREFSEVPQEGRLRISIVGDSISWGQGIPAEARYSSLLEEGLQQNIPEIEILNYGICGAETNNHMEILSETVLPGRPNLVLLQWYPNDVELDKSDRPRYRRLISHWNLDWWLHRHSALYFLLNRAWWSTRTRLGLMESYPESMLRRFGDPMSDEATRATAVMNRLIETLVAESIPLVIVAFPNLRVDSDGRTESEFLVDRLLEQCEGKGVVCVDLRPVLLDRSGSTAELWVNRFDNHPNELANRLVAHELLLEVPWEMLLKGSANESGRAMESAGSETGPSELESTEF